jgi:hypothetical protein
MNLQLSAGDSGSTVVKVLRYKSEGRWFIPRWCQWNFSLTSRYDPEVDLYQEYFLVVKSAGA